jgi:hypothetical protein
MIVFRISANGIERYDLSNKSLSLYTVAEDQISQLTTGSW